MADDSAIRFPGRPGVSGKAPVSTLDPKAFRISIPPEAINAGPTSITGAINDAVDKLLETFGTSREEFKEGHPIVTEGLRVGTGQALREAFAPTPVKDLTPEQRKTREAHDRLVEDWTSTKFGKGSILLGKSGLYLVPATRVFKGIRSVGLPAKVGKLLGVEGALDPTHAALIEAALAGVVFEAGESAVTGQELTLEELSATVGVFMGFIGVIDVVSAGGKEIAAWYKYMRASKQLKEIDPQATPADWYKAFWKTPDARHDLVETLKAIPDADKQKFAGALIREGAKIASGSAKVTEVPPMLSTPSRVYRTLYDKHFTEIERTMSANRMQGKRGDWSTVDEINEFIKDRTKDIRNGKEAFDMALKKGRPDLMDDAREFLNDGLEAAKTISKIHPLLKRATKPHINTANTMLNKVEQAEKVMVDTQQHVSFLIDPIKVTTTTSEASTKVAEYFETADKGAADLYVKRVMGGMRSLNRFFNNPTANLERQFLKHPLSQDDTAQQVLVDMSMVRGADALTEATMKQASKNYFNNYSRGELKELSRVSTLRRVIALTDFDNQRKVRIMSQLETINNKIKELKPKLTDPDPEVVKIAKFQINNSKKIAKKLKVVFKQKYTAPGDMTKPDAQAYLSDMDPKFLDRAMKDLDGIKRDIFDRIMDERLAEGIVSAKDYRAIKQVGFYQPTRWLNSLDRTVNYKVGGKSYSVTLSGKPKYLESGQNPGAEEMRLIRLQQGVVDDLQNVKEGSKQFKELSQQYDEISTIISEQRSLRGLALNDIYALSYQSLRTHNSILMRNRAAHSANKLAAENPRNGVFMQPIKGAEEPPPGWTNIYRLEQGEQIPLWIREEFADEWLSLTGETQNMWLNMFGWITGQHVIKFAATGPGNPFWGITNLMLDSMHLYSSAYQYSNNPIKFAAELSRDLKRVSKDVVNKRGIYQDYGKDGGLMDFMYQESELSSPIKTSWTGLKMPGQLSRGVDAAQSGLNFLNSYSEVAVRCAHYRRTAVDIVKKKGIENADELGWNSLKKHLTPGERRQAAHAARSRMDFPHAGTFWKLSDSVFPYTKAGFVAGRATYRAIKAHPRDAAIRAAYAASTAMLIRGAAWGLSPHTMKQISPETSIDNFVMPTKYSIRDAKGMRRDIYFKFRKDPSIRLATGIVEGVMDEMVAGQPYDWDRFGKAMAEIAPWNPEVSGSPALYAVLGAMTNVDPKSGERIWRGPDFPSEYRAMETDEYISPTLAAMAKSMNMSAYRLRYVLQQYFTYNNPYAVYIGLATDPILDEMPELERKTMLETVLKLPGIDRVIGLTNPYELFRKPMEEGDKENNVVRHKERVEVRRAINLHLQNPDRWPDEFINDTIKRVAPPTQIQSLINMKMSYLAADRALNAAAEKFDGKFVPRSVLFKMVNMSSEARAISLFKAMQGLDEGRSEVLFDITQNIFGFWDTRTIIKWEELLKEK